MFIALATHKTAQRPTTCRIAQHACARPLRGAIPAGHPVLPGSMCWGRSASVRDPEGYRSGIAVCKPKRGVLSVPMGAGEGARKTSAEDCAPELAN
jgi:hypothetical protein